MKQAERSQGIQAVYSLFFFIKVSNDCFSKTVNLGVLTSVAEYASYYLAFIPLLNLNLP